MSPSDRVNIKPVKLEIDTSGQIRPHHYNTPFDIPYHMREPSDKEFKNILDAGIISKVDHPTFWCSRAFPVIKTGSDPLAVRWVADFKPLNVALKRPV